MCCFLLFVVVYGVWKTKNTKNIDGYIRANRSTPWYVVTLSIMATQASAITFISTPGQAYTDGMRFVQFYLGLPVAMIILSITAVPIFHKLNIYTAYEYLEKRFDLKNRVLGSVLFLTQRGLAAGFTIFAPALILSVLLGWNINYAIFVMGGLVILYTTVGGSIAVNKTHIQQMIIIMTGMITAFVVIISLLPPDISFKDAAFVAGKMGKFNTIDFSFDLNNRYTFWSGLIGGTFLMLSYFGTDQSQVQRYLGGSSIKQSRMGLLANGIVKIPMQFFILFTGAMVFVFFQFVTPPLFFNPVQENKVKSGEYSQQYKELEKQYNNLNKEKQQHIKEMLTSIDAGNGPKTNDAQEKVQNIHKKEIKVRESALLLIKEANPGADTNDTNYIFLNFVIHFLPIGLIGLVLASIISASMSSTSAELNALASTTVIDFYKRLIKKDASESHYLKISKLATVFWGIYAIIFALFANRLGTLIEAVNILGSLVYGTILGIFLVAFYLKKVKGSPTFYAALVAEVAVLYCFLFTKIPFLWYNVIGCLLVIFLSLILNTLVVKQKR
ncbi:MAG: sodium:solute symporter [Ignavibacteria bacterium GWB2_36_8]|nr:MAG: sodium:solute symporter [Ignavibacteria bacterium GWB2_36_8]OGU50058.1 MAG: sodium:solute symporter [Ignavibacteria bacterium GWC2_36_12]